MNEFGCFGHHLMYYFGLELGILLRHEPNYMQVWKLPQKKSQVARIGAQQHHDKSLKMAFYVDFLWGSE